MQNRLRIQIQIIKVKKWIKHLDEITHHIDHADILHKIRNGILPEPPLQLLIKSQYILLSVHHTVIKLSISTSRY